MEMMIGRMDGKMGECLIVPFWILRNLLIFSQKKNGKAGRGRKQKKIA
jgi:hypothetical protein